MLDVVQESGAEARIVVGVDGSPASVAALRWALRQARPADATVEVVHVWTASVSPFNSIPIAQAGFRSERDAARDVLVTSVARARDTERDDDAVPVHEELASGYPAEVLRVKARGARMVVVGSPRHSKRLRLLHKTVAQALLTGALCRVVIVAADGSVVHDSALPSAPG
jgi:nucleotide-binding universal stress UspA family protein